ncbi:MAG: hypothetical protein RIT28_798 [Pseudomonadota bacterium]
MPPVQDLTIWLNTSRPSLLRRLRHRFPRVCASGLEDAAQEAALTTVRLHKTPGSCVQRAWDRSAEDLERLVFTFAWRSLRGELRRGARRGQVPTEGGWRHRDAAAQVEAQDTLRRARRLIPDAAQIHAPRAAPALTAALEDRLTTGDDDLAVAIRHGVHRSVLCRARRWILTTLVGEPRVRRL